MMNVDSVVVENVAVALDEYKRGLEGIRERLMFVLRADVLEPGTRAALVAVVSDVELGAEASAELSKVVRALAYGCECERGDK